MVKSKLTLPVKPKAILFDWDNTLVDSMMLVHQALNHTLVTYGIEPWTYKETIARSHQSYLEYAPNVFGNKWQEALDIYRARYLELRVDMKAFHYAEEVLALLKEHQIYTALISNKIGHILREEVNILGWDYYFGKIIGSGDLDRDKSSPITVDSSLRNINVTPTECSVWFIGDSVTDMETAYNSKCMPVLFGDDDYNGERFAHCRPKIIFTEHKKLLHYLEICIKGDNDV